MPAARRVAAAPRAVSQPAPGYLAWWDATQITGVADGASLTSWPSSDGLNPLASPPTGGSAINEPTYYKTTVAKLINGKPAVWFASSSTPANNQLMTCNGPIRSALAAGRPYLFFFVAQDLTPAASALKIIFSSSSGGVQFWNASNVINAWAGAQINSAAIEDGNPHVYCYELTAGGAGSNIYRDGISVASGNAGTTLINNSDNCIGVGADPTGGGGINGFGWNGPICELLIYNTDTPAIRATNQAYLKAKWGTP